MAFKFVVFATLLALARAGVPLGYAAAPVAYAAPIAKTIVAEPHAPAHYDFGYGVSDPHTGDIKSQQESRRGDVVQGSYSLVESDGTRRVVEYAADPIHGFNAVVHKEGIAAHAAPVAVAHAAPVAVAHAAPIVAHAAPVAVAHAAPVAVAHAAPVLAHSAVPALGLGYSRGLGLTSGLGYARGLGVASGLGYSSGLGVASTLGYSHGLGVSSSLGYAHGLGYSSALL